MKHSPALATTPENQPLDFSALLKRDRITRPQVDLRRSVLSSASTSWSLLDQGLVSGFNFAVGVLLARQLGLAAFGAYVVAQTYLQYVNVFQSALVVWPMMTAVPAQRDPAAQHGLLRGFFTYTILVLLLTSAGVMLIAWLLGRRLPALALGTAALPLCAAIASFQIQDWLRRVLYVRTANRAVFLGDVVAYGGQWSGLAFLAWRGALTLGAALWVLAGSFAFSAVGILAALRLTPDFRAGAAVIRTHWRSSCDYLLSAQLQWLAASGVVLIGTSFIGTQAAGAIRAAQNLLGPFNVLFQWMDNVIPVRSALRLREGGRHQLAVYLRRLSWIGSVALGLFVLLLLPTDKWMMETIYGAAYRPFAVLVVLQALYFLFGHLYRMQTYYNRALGQTGTLVCSSFWWAAVGVSCALLTVNALAERGIMIALVAGEIAGLLYLLWDRRK